MDNEAELDRLTGCNLVRRIGGGPTDDALRVISTIDCTAEFYAFMNIVLITYSRSKQVGSSRFLPLIRLMKLGTNASNLRRDPTHEEQSPGTAHLLESALSQRFEETRFIPKILSYVDQRERIAPYLKKSERNDMEKCIGFLESCAHVRWTLPIGSPCFRVHGYERSRRRH